MNVLVARIYLSEASHIHEKVFQRLHDEHKVKGVTVFRGITGFGKSGQEHSSKLLDISFDLPVIIEFFDEEEKVLNVLKDVKDQIPDEHVLTFKANLS